MIGFILSVFRKRRAQRSPQSIPVAVLDLDEAETPRKGYYLVTILLVFFIWCFGLMCFLLIHVILLMYR